MARMIWSNVRLGSVAEHARRRASAARSSRPSRTAPARIASTRWKPMIGIESSAVHGGRGSTGGPRRSSAQSLHQRCDARPRPTWQPLHRRRQVLNRNPGDLAGTTFAPRLTSIVTSTPAVPARSRSRRRNCRRPTTSTRLPWNAPGRRYVDRVHDLAAKCFAADDAPALPDST